MELFWIIFPIELLYMIDANAILGLIYSILQWFVIIGIIGILENKTKVDTPTPFPADENE